MPSRLGWSLRFSEVVLADPPFIVLQVVPVMAGLRPDLFELGILFDVLELVESVKSRQGRQLLNVGCGYPPDGDIEGTIRVLHLDERTIARELDRFDFWPALEERPGEGTTGSIRFLFKRDDYEPGVRDVIREVKAVSTTPVGLRALGDVRGLAAMRRGRPAIESIEVGLLEPEVRGLELDRVIELDVLEVRRLG